MRLTVEYPDAMDAKIREVAEAEGQVSRGAVIRKALAFFLDAYTSKNKRKQDKSEVK